MTIGTKFAEDMIESMRDEVLLEFIMKGRKLELRGTVLVDGETVSGNSKLRNEIFLREMPTVLQAVRYADHRLFECCKQLNNVPVNILFKSNNQEFNKVYNFRTIGAYR